MEPLILMVGALLDMMLDDPSLFPPSSLVARAITTSRLRLIDDPHIDQLADSFLPASRPRRSV